jgi:hypothetical protein
MGEPHAGERGWASGKACPRTKHCTVGYSPALLGNPLFLTVPIDRCFAARFARRH